MDQKELNILVSLLHQASQLEHSLLDCYLYTASTIKSMPEEFERLSDGALNKRRAIQFEKARLWKQSMLNVSHEEMLHLHYVQCLLRALGQSPYFDLPIRNEKKNGWLIPNWDIHVEGQSPSSGTEIPLAGLTIDQIRQFILFESTDSLQDEDPFGNEIMALFTQLFDFELNMHLEGLLYNIQDDGKRLAIKTKLLDVYRNQPPTDRKGVKKMLAAMGEEEVLKYVRFQSIGDFYLKGILPLYQQAFDKGWVKNANRAFNDEILGPNAAEGFLPIGPVYRSKNYTDFSNANTENPLKHFKNVRDIIIEIVEEGEGFSDFRLAAQNLLSKVREIGGERKYLEAWKKDKNNAGNENYSTPEWLASGELCRQSHLYRFAMIFMDMKFEEDISLKHGVDFKACRTKLQVTKGNSAIEKMLDEMPRQFNACYMVMLLWLSRIYETKDWQADKDRRYAIEMIATWPLMSLAIRPFLELMSFFPVDESLIFNITGNCLPGLPTEAQQLLQYFNSTKRNESINKDIDYLALRVLKNTAEWALEKVGSVEDHYKGVEAEMIVTRLKGLGRLGEFEKQFPFRSHGGYSNQMPDLFYQQNFPDAAKYSEDPTLMDSVFQDSLVLRLRFGGFGLVQLSTDPDPPTDEAGCTGTHMLHAVESGLKFDRAQVWQNMPGQKNILREPREKLPPIGVNLIDMTLQVTDSNGASAGYVPLQIMQSSGAVQTSGVQQYLKVEGLNDLAQYAANTIDKKTIRINLLEKDGIRPYGYGDNHLVSKDGEPIDPFIISITDSDFNNILQREVFNDGKFMTEMNPLQRLQSARWPTGFDSNLRDIPDWFMNKIDPGYRTLVLDKGPIAYLANRSIELADVLEGLLNSQNIKDQNKIDQIISYAERLYLISMPRGTTVGWLTVLLNYGHTISGMVTSNEKDNLLSNFFEKSLNLKVNFLPSETDRDKANSRWVIKYTEGVMDTDAITDVVYGEIFIPINVMPSSEQFSIKKKWEFSSGMLEVVAPFACDFYKPFWDTFQIDGDKRIITLPDGTVITETLKNSDKYSYTYSAVGFSGISNYIGGFSTKALTSGNVELELSISFNYDSGTSFTAMAVVLGNFFQKAGSELNNHFKTQTES